ncbi:hypothetical protein RvY_02910 [Ramazzottius varieornatus]|uniref:Uncharacterized protein n=1 Tax=Ramazzottius varieornatus TaxID=947166 RepID=A0A1D1ULC5_RAMVA|nr:hypothetical protein RvY_02910 [Ramazzottius varieornatus]
MLEPKAVIRRTVAYTAGARISVQISHIYLLCSPPLWSDLFFEATYPASVYKVSGKQNRFIRTCRSKVDYVRPSTLEYPKRPTKMKLLIVVVFYLFRFCLLARSRRMSPQLAEAFLRRDLNVNTWVCCLLLVDG